MNTMNVYGCGGAGIKLAHHFDALANFENVAKFNPIYLDTGNSNIDGVQADPKRCYVFEIKDAHGRIVAGAGKNRALVAKSVSANIGQVVEKFEPVFPLNIVIFGGGGGSGSVIGPYLIKTLLENDFPVLAITIGTSESIKATENSINTIKTLDNFARNAGCPIVMSYHYNGAKSQDPEVDKDVRRIVLSLGVLCSNENHGLDTEDIKHWLQFHQVTQVEPQLASLEIVNSVDEVREIGYPVSIASLLKPESNSDIGSVGADYYCDGPICVDTINETHYVVDVNTPQEILESLDSALSNLKKRAAARPKTNSLAGGAGGDDGCVL